MKMKPQRTREDIKAKLSSAYGMMVSRQYECFTTMGEDERTSTYKVFSAIASGYAQILVREDMEKEMGDTIKDHDNVWVEVGEYLSGKEKIGSIYGMVADMESSDSGDQIREMSEAQEEED